MRPFRSSGLTRRSTSDFWPGLADLAVVMFTEQRYGDAEPLAKWALQVRQADPKTKHTTLIQNVLLLAMIER